MNSKNIISNNSVEETDVEKCCGFTVEKMKGQYDAMVIVGGLGGPRWDHSCACFHCCFKWPSENIVLCDEDCACYVIDDAGGEEQQIEVDQNWEGPHCGICPMAEEAKVTTRGLKFDLKDEKIKMGKKISVGNLIKQDKISVKCNKPVLWIEEIKSSKLSTD